MSKSGTSAGWKLDRDEGEARWFFSNLALVKVRKEQGGGRFSLVDSAGAQGDMPPLHVHENDDELFYVLEGEINYWVGNAEPFRAEPGALVFAPRGVPHTYRVESPTARWIVTTTSGGFASFVAETSRPAGDDGYAPAEAMAAPDVLVAAAARHDIEILGPPGATP